MRRSAQILALSGLAAGCAHTKPPQVPRPDYESVRSRSDDAFESLQREEKGLPAKAPQRASAPAPATPSPRAKLLRKDPQGCTWIESEAAVTVGGDQGLNQVRAAAVSSAEQSAMQDFLGVEVKSRFMDYQQASLRDEQTLTENMLLSTRNGRILDERVVSEDYQEIPGCPHCRYRVVLHVCLAPPPADADKDFFVDLKVEPRQAFVSGDEARLKVTASRDCYLYLYDVDLKGETTLMIPNEFVPEVKLKAGETWEYPGEELRRRGVHLVAQLPEGKEKSLETIRVIASKSPLPQSIQSPAAGYLGIFRTLNASRLDWAESAEAFTISVR